MKTATQYDVISDKNEKCEKYAEYIIQTGCTVREAAKYFGVSKSTVHIYVTERLKKFDLKLYYCVREVLLKNKAERHLRGGEATRCKYLRQAQGQCHPPGSREKRAEKVKS